MRKQLDISTDITELSSKNRNIHKSMVYEAFYRNPTLTVYYKGIYYEETNHRNT